MATQKLSSLSSPLFPQVIPGVMDRYIAHVDRILAECELTTCCHESPESSWGASDGLVCSAKATIHELATEREYCARHFREVSILGSNQAKDSNEYFAMTLRSWPAPRYTQLGYNFGEVTTRIVFAVLLLSSFALTQPIRKPQPEPKPEPTMPVRHDGPMRPPHAPRFAESL
jgi:hypothetical protein